MAKKLPWCPSPGPASPPGRLFTTCSTTMTLIRRKNLTPSIHYQSNCFVDPRRWWLIASAFPMIAGALGPVASAFSICALAKEWRQHLPPGAEIESNNYPQPDPAWCVLQSKLRVEKKAQADPFDARRLIAVNAVQLAMALVSNIFLLLNMARRVRFTIAQPITIAGWYVARNAALSNSRPVESTANTCNPSGIYLPSALSPCVAQHQVR